MLAHNSLSSRALSDPELPEVQAGLAGLPSVSPLAVSRAAQKALEAEQEAEQQAVRAGEVASLAPPRVRLLSTSFDGVSGLTTSTTAGEASATAGEASTTAGETSATAGEASATARETSATARETSTTAGEASDLESGVSSTKDSHDVDKEEEGTANEAASLGDDETADVGDDAAGESDNTSESNSETPMPGIGGLSLSLDTGGAAKAKPKATKPTKPTKARSSKSVRDLPVAEELGRRREIKVMSWNIWFGDVAVLSRLEAIGRIVEKEQPDVLALQEVTPPVLGHLLKQEWAQRYYVSDGTGSSLHHYGVVMFSVFPMASLEIHELRSRLQRRAVFASFLLPSGEVLCVASAHLESYETEAKIRASQLAHIFGRLCKATYAVFMGDTNMCSPDEEAVLTSKYDKFMDVWPALRPHDPGYTVEPVLSAMCGRSAKEEQRQLRLDRIFVSDSVCACVMRHVGTSPIPIVNQEGASYLEKPIPEGVDVYPSDHYGVVAVLSLQQPTPVTGPGPALGLGLRLGGGEEEEGGAPPPPSSSGIPVVRTSAKAEGGELGLGLSLQLESLSLLSPPSVASDSEDVLSPCDLSVCLGEEGGPLDTPAATECSLFEM